MRLNITQIKNKDIFFECDRENCQEFIAFGDAYLEDNIWYIHAMNSKTRQIIDYIFTIGYEQYWPRLYSERVYVEN